MVTYGQRPDALGRWRITVVQVTVNFTAVKKLVLLLLGGFDLKKVDWLPLIGISPMANALMQTS